MAAVMFEDPLVSFQTNPDAMLLGNRWKSFTTGDGLVGNWSPALKTGA